MLGRTHLLFGVFLVIVIIKYFGSIFSSKVYLLVAIFLALITSILPDIDEHKSMLGRKLKPLSYAMTHRGFFHSFLFVVLVVIIIISFNKMLSFIVLAAFMSHLLLDAMTVQGITPFWPFKWRIKGIVRTGGLVENIFALFLVIVIIVIIIL